MITPREMLRDYMTLLNILLQNENTTFEEIVEKTVKLQSESTQPQESTTLTVQLQPKESPKPERKAFNPADIDF